MRIALAALVFCSSLIAPAPGAAAQKVPVARFGTVTTLDHEDERAFILRTAKIAQAYTNFNDHEFCARICRAPDGRLAAPLLTGMSSLGCPLNDECPEGFVATDKSIHTHPASIPRRVTQYDIPYLRGRGMRALAHVGRVFRPDHATRFSQVDYDNGPGYLVAEGKVLFQDGEDASRLFGTVPD